MRQAPEARRMRRHYRLLSALVAAATAAGSSPAWAVFKFWVPPGGVGTWDATTGSLWNPPGVPGSTDTVVIHASRRATIASAVPDVQTIRLGDGSDGTLTL